MKPLVLADGAILTVRAIEPDDVDRLERMFHRLSPETVYRRFFSPVQRPPHKTLERLANVDHHAREALVALYGDEIVAVARYDTTADEHEAEIAVTVEDAWQHRGLGRRLARRLATEAVTHGIDHFVATMLPENRAALALLRNLSPAASVRFDGGTCAAVAPLEQAS